MENEFPPAENEEMPGVEDAIPLVAIMVLVQGVMLPSGELECNMAPALGRKALEFMIISLVIHNPTEYICRRWNVTNYHINCTDSKVFQCVFH